MSTIATINTVSVSIIGYIGVPLIVMGCFGNVFNIIIFTRPSLITSPCNIYLLGSAIASLGFIIVAAPLTVYTSFTNFDPRVTNLVFCRTQYFLLYFFLVLSTWFIVLASIDRFCITSPYPKLRNFNKNSIARRLSLAIIILAIVAYSHILFLFQILQSSTGLSCRQQPGIYLGFFDFFYFGTFSFTPPIFLIIISIGTYYQIYRSRNRVAVTAAWSQNPSATNHNQLNKKDRQLVTMIFLQIIAKIIFTSPHALQKFYIMLAVGPNTSPLELAILSLVTQISRVLLLLNTCISFYLYNSLTTSVFHQEFIRLINKMIGCVLRKAQQNHSPNQHNNRSQPNNDNAKNNIKSTKQVPLYPGRNVLQQPELESVPTPPN